MNAGSTFLGDNKIKQQIKTIDGTFARIDGEQFYKISNYNQMADFFMSIVSDSDHWMFLSSNGALSAGRKNRDNALFPYYTDDKIHDYRGITGSTTTIRVSNGEKVSLWEPFTEISERIYNIECQLYKSIYGNKIIFEEVNHDLGLSFSYTWSNSEKFGFVRTSKITNLSNEKKEVALIDGIQNILPYGVDFDFQNAYSNLLDGYKKNELLPSSGLGLFMLSSIPVDRAEPSESLRTTCVWSNGTESDRKILLSTKQVKAFSNGGLVTEEVDIRATRGAYLIHQEITLEKEAQKTWDIIAEINQDAADVKTLESYIKNTSDIASEIKSDIALGTNNLRKIVASADGLQVSDEELGSARHFSNTMFNVMRGGIFNNNYTINSTDFALFVKQSNTKLAETKAPFLSALPEQIEYNTLFSKIEQDNSADLTRLCMEYLPLTFSRRHGDPSRPWNISP